MVLTSYLKLILDGGKSKVPWAFPGKSYRLISSSLAGPAEDVVEKWPWLKTPEHDSSHTLFHVRKNPLEDVVVRVWKGLGKGAKTGSAGSVNLQKSNREEALKDEGGKKGN